MATLTPEEIDQLSTKATFHLNRITELLDGIDHRIDTKINTMLENNELYYKDSIFFRKSDDKPMIYVGGR